MNIDQQIDFLEKKIVALGKATADLQTQLELLKVKKNNPAATSRKGLLDKRLSKFALRYTTGRYGTIK